MAKITCWHDTKNSLSTNITDNACSDCLGAALGHPLPINTPSTPTYAPSTSTNTHSHDLAIRKNGHKHTCALTTSTHTRLERHVCPQMVGIYSVGQYCIRGRTKWVYECSEGAQAMPCRTHGDSKKTAAKKAGTNQQNRTQTNGEKCNQKIPNETLPILNEQTKTPGLKYVKIRRTS